MDLSTLVENIKGVGPKKKNILNSLGIYTVEDLLFYFPRRYEDLSIFKTLGEVIDEKASFKLKFETKIRSSYIRKNLHILSYRVFDGYEYGEVVFFNQSFLEKNIVLGRTYLVNGRAKRERYKVTITSPIIDFRGDKVGRIIPVYSLKKGITNNELLKLIDSGIKSINIPEIIPESIVKKYGLMNRKKALQEVHFPVDRDIFIRARNRLVFEELFLYQLLLFKLRHEDSSVEIIAKTKTSPLLNDFLDSLSFKLTKGQLNALDEILRDMNSGKKMNRMLQGDVGSGKTIVAVSAMIHSYLNGYQSTIMVPTEVLAKQHYETITSLVGGGSIVPKVALLTASIPKSEKEEIKKRLSNGEIDILIGTHAIIKSDVEFKKLGLTVTDEQHRFGVRQRSIFMGKGDSHTLVMTATPIPRTLSLTLYGDLDISIIDTMPSGRIPIETYAINKSMLNRAIGFVKAEVEKGHQAYIVAPLIEDSEYLDLDSAERIYEDLKGIFGSGIGIVHGSMSSKDKEEVMGRFVENKISVLVSTTVIEVGINVPNATIMLIYNAQQFGLAQLHQLRGRVGRGSAKSYCILYNSSNTETSWKRMKIMEQSTDGFYIANKDMELRGRGDIFGTRQHGDMSFKIADLSRDIEVLKLAQVEAKNLIEMDPNLDNLENERLKIILDEKLNTITLSNIVN